MFGSTQCLSKIAQEKVLKVILENLKMTRQNEWLAEHCLSGGGAVVFPGRCAESQEDPWEVDDPVRHGAEGVEGILQAEVEGCFHPVGLQVVGSSLVVLMLRKLQRAAHREEVNWAPQSEVMTAGTPNPLTHPWNKAFMKSTVEVAAIGMASGQREVLSLIVKR
jgi:hypothetical protein